MAAPVVSRPGFGVFFVLMLFGVIAACRQPAGETGPRQTTLVIAQTGDPGALNLP